LGLAACVGADAGRAAAQGHDSAHATSLQVATEVHGACSAVAAWWRQRRAEVRVVDSLLVPPLADRAVAGCVVQATQEHGAQPLTGEPAGGLETGERSASALIAGTGQDWVSLPRYAADGPDGSVVGYQRGAVRCVVAASWDGGDDSDSTYVREDWLKEETSCWPEPGGIAVTDTAP
jgi:hypothetical protein